MPALILLITRYFIGSGYILPQLNERVFKVTLEQKKHLIGRKSSTYGALSCIVYGKIAQIKTTSTQKFLESLFSIS